MVLFLIFINFLTFSTTTAVNSSAIIDFPSLRTYYESLHENPGDYRFAGGSDTTSSAYPWVAGIVEGVAPSYTKYGAGAIIRPQWLIAHSFFPDVPTGLQNPTGIFIVIGRNKIDDLPTTPVHRAKQVIIYGDAAVTATDIYISLIKFCPPTADGNVVPIPTTQRTYTLGEQVVFLNYVDNLHKATKIVVDDCLCEVYKMDYDVTRTFCVEENLNLKPEATDYKGALAYSSVTSQFLGLSLSSTKGPDIYLDVSKYITWITEQIAANS